MTMQQLDNDLVSVQLKTLINLAKPAASLQLRKQRIRAANNGGYLSAFKGRGMEFDEARPYQTSDDIRNIDWRVTARTNETYTKVYREERERPVFISVDYRASMQFATRGVFKSVQAAKLAALLAWSANHHGDRVGGQIFTEHSCLELKPKANKHGVLNFLNALSNQTTPTDSKISLAEVLARLSQHCKPGSQIYLISDFRHLSAQVERHLSRLSRHCEVVLVQIYDPLEAQLPPKGSYRLTDSVRDVFIDSSNKQLLIEHQHKFQQQQHYLADLCKKWRMRLLHCSTTDDPIEVLA